MKLLVTGGCGFLGSNLAAHAIGQGMDVTVFDNLSRLGSGMNKAWLESLGTFNFIHGDIRNGNDVANAVRQIQPEMVFHLAGQVAMTTSLANPRADFEINALGSFNLLDAIRTHAPQCGVIYSSTNKVYGELEQYHYSETDTRYECVEHPAGFDEQIPLDFRSPYGCSKGAADQYMLDFSRMFGLRTAVFRHSSMYGGRQFSTFDQGWIGWFCAEAERIRLGRQERLQIAGNGKQVRDVLHAKDMVSLYFKAAANLDQLAGQAFNIGGGMHNSLSLRELFALLGEAIGRPLVFDSGPVRSSDQKVFVADLGKIGKLLQWQPQVDCRSGVTAMLEWLRSEPATLS